MKPKIVETHSFIYRFYSHKIKNLTPSGKLFYLKSKLEYISTLSYNDIGKFLFSARCKQIIDLLIKELKEYNELLYTNS